MQLFVQLLQFNHSLVRLFRGNVITPAYYEGAIESRQQEVDFIIARQIRIKADYGYKVEQLFR